MDDTGSSLMRFRWWLVIASGIFLLGIVLGLVMTETITGLLSEDIARLEELATQLGPFQVSTAIFILLKNIVALVASFILSPLLCLMPLFALTVNGWLIAIVAGVAVRQESIWFVLGALLPHGVLELPAFIIGEAAALSFGVMALTALVFPERRSLLLPNLKQNLKYLGLAIALLVPAALIETFITPLLVS